MPPKIHLFFSEVQTVFIFYLAESVLECMFEFTKVFIGMPQEVPLFNFLSCQSFTHCLLCGDRSLSKQEISKYGSVIYGNIERAIPHSSDYPFELNFSTVPAFKLLHLEAPLSFLISATVVPCRCAISQSVSPLRAL